MRTLHDAAFRAEIDRRIDSLTSSSTRKWGKMTVDQAVWHCNQAMDMALGNFHPPQAKLPPLPKFLLSWLVINTPWPKGAPTNPGMLAVAAHDLTAQQARAHKLIDDFASKPVNAAWAKHVDLGPMDGMNWSRLMAKHYDYHLRQFSA